MENHKPADIDNIWRNVYWFARLLVNTDQHAGFGSNTAHVAVLSGALRTVLDGPANAEKLDDAELLEVLKATLRETLSKFSGATTKRHAAHNLLAEALNNRIDSIDDFKVLLFTCENVLIPTNALLDAVPSSDKDFTNIIGKAYLETQGEEGLATVINLWDDAGVQGSLTAERVLVVNAFRTLRTNLTNDWDVFETDADHILSAFVQEIERRLGQKRKSRAGGSLEDVTSVILSHFRIPTTHKPKHFQADIEVDKWVRGADGWLIGISCKRTLRERWKQVSSADSSILSKFKIREVWHVITYSNDLSEDKLVTLGAGRHIFYLPDESPAYKTFSKHIGMKDYVRPMSNFISDLKKVTKTK
ncbi:MAG: hypothetical protein KF736_06690 [Acidobacteria bacterium]|nr:hypothetical protein [Acidobacteriota bacterium]